MANMGEIIKTILGGAVFNKDFRRVAQEYLLGGQDKTKQLSLMTPEQKELMKLLQQGVTGQGGPFSELGGFNEESFQKGVVNPALKNFQDNILPMLQEKFISGNQVGGSGMQRGFQKAGVDLQSELAKLMYQAQQDQLKNRLSAAQGITGQRAVENIYQQGNMGAIPAFLQGAGKGIGQAAGAYMVG